MIDSEVKKCSIRREAKITIGIKPTHCMGSSYLVFVGGGGGAGMLVCRCVTAKFEAMCHPYCELLETITG